MCLKNYLIYFVFITFVALFLPAEKMVKISIFQEHVYKVSRVRNFN